MPVLSRVTMEYVQDGPPRILEVNVRYEKKEPSARSVREEARKKAHKDFPGADAIVLGDGVMTYGEGGANGGFLRYYFAMTLYSGNVTKTRPRKPTIENRMP